MKGNSGYLIRAERIRAITMEHYQPERHDRCYKWVWRRYIRPVYGITYHTYLRYLRVNPEEIERNSQQLKLF